MNIIYLIAYMLCFVLVYSVAWTVIVFVFLALQKGTKLES